MKKILTLFLVLLSFSIQAQTRCDSISAVVTNTPGIGTINYDPDDLADSLNATFGVSNNFAYWFAQMQSCGDSCTAIVPCDSFAAALSQLGSYVTAGGTNGPYSAAFAGAYLGVMYQNYNTLDTTSWNAIFACCQPPNINYGVDTLTHCETIEYLRIIMQYVLPGRTCLPSWLYNYLLSQLLPQIPVVTDSTVDDLCKDLGYCHISCLNICNDTIISSCDSIRSVYYVYQNLLANEELSIDTNLLDNAYQMMYGQSLPYATIMSAVNNCNPNDTAIFTQITYNAANLSYSTDSSGHYYADFDLMATDTPNNLLFSQGYIYVVYDTTLFGSSIVSRGAITATRGTIDSFYNLSLSDSSYNILRLSLTHDSTNLLTNLDSVNTNQQLCHLRINISSFNLTAVGAYFDTLAMAGASLYQSTPNGIALPYDKVLVSGLVGNLRDDETISFTLDSFVVDDVANTISFSVFATSSPDPTALFSAGIIINFDTAAFGPFIYGSGFVGADAGALSLDYDITPTDQFLSGTELELDITNFSGNYDTVNGSPIDIADVTISFAYPRCLNAAGIVGDNFNTPYDSSYYWDDINGVPVGYVNSSVSGQYNSELCPPPPPPHVSYWTPTCANAGSFQVLQIFGSNFGSSQFNTNPDVPPDTGEVFFTNANPRGGQFISTQPQDILSWSDGEIDLLVPSITDSGNVAIAASGHFYVYAVTGTGMSNLADSETISIGYANRNLRYTADPSSPDYNKAMFVYYPSGNFTFQMDTAMFNNMTAVHTIEDAIADINCHTGFNFLLDTVAPASIDIPMVDNIHLISLNPYSSGVFGTRNPNTLEQTFLNDRVQICNNGLSLYNNWSAYVTDADIAIRSDLFIQGDTYTWAWSDTATLDTTMVDFYSVIEHELSHVAGLDHTRPYANDSNIMFYATVPGKRTKGYNGDPDDALGIINILSLGQTLGQASSCASTSYQTSVYNCSTPQTPSGCVLRVNNVNGISDIAPDNGNAFNASLYPNPYEGTTVVHIETSAYEAFTVTVYDVIGHVVRQINIASGTSFDVPLSDFQQSAGMYLIQVSDSQTRQVLKMIKL